MIPPVVRAFTDGALGLLNRRESSDPRLLSMRTERAYGPCTVDYMLCPNCRTLIAVHDSDDVRTSVRVTNRNDARRCIVMVEFGQLVHRCTITRAIWN